MQQANRRALMGVVIQKAIRTTLGPWIADPTLAAAAVMRGAGMPLLDLYLSARAERDEAEAACAGLLAAFDKASEKGPPWGGDPGHALMRARVVLALAAERDAPKEAPKTSG